MIDYEKVTVTELEKEITKLKRDLEELEEERTFVLRQTGVHVSGATVKQYEADVEGTKERIVELQRILQRKLGTPSISEGNRL